MTIRPQDDLDMFAIISGVTLTDFGFIPLSPIDTRGYGAVDYLVEISAGSATTFLMQILNERQVSRNDLIPLTLRTWPQTGQPPHSTAEHTPVIIDVDASATGFIWVPQVPAIGAAQRPGVVVTGGPVTFTVYTQRRNIVSASWGFPGFDE